MKNCSQCGTLMPVGRRRDARYCSQECNSRAFHERRQARGGYDRRTHPLVCTGCGSSYVGRKDSKFCAKECSAKFNNAKLYPVDQRKPTPRLRAALRRQAKAAQGTTGSRWVWTQGHCNRCSTQFTIRGSWPARYCTKRCKKRDIHDRHRARRVAAYVEDVVRHQVFTRDGYRCHICRKKTNPTKPVPHPRAPTIDHVIPLAGGGTHEPLNCRTACFACNCHKRDAGGGEQLLLIA